MTESILDIAGIKATLYTAQVDCQANRFHLDRRVVPALEAIAGDEGDEGDERLPKAIAEARKASEQLGAARETLLAALDLVTAYAPD